VDGVLLEDLPYPDPERLVQVGMRPPQFPDWMGPVSEEIFLDMRDGISQLETVAAVSSSIRVLRELGDPTEVRVGAVSAGYLDLLGARASLGRTLQPSDHKAGATKVAVLSSTFFENRFGADPDVLGIVLDLNGEPLEVVGVLSPEFLPPTGIRGRTSAFWTPLGLSQRELNPLFHLDVIGLARPGATPATIQEEASQVLTEHYPADRPEALRPEGWVESLRSRVLGDSGQPILLAQGGLALLLILTCVNVASLLLARASTRRPEMAIRSAIGARRERMIRQLLSESLILAVLAGGAGVGLAVVLVRWFKAMAPEGIPLLPTVTVDGEVLAFAFFLCLLSSVLFGLLPALKTTRADPAAILGTSGPGRTDSRASAATLRFLVVGEVSMATVLVLGAGLLTSSFLHLTRVDLGFQPEGLATIRVDPRRSHLNAENPALFFRQLLDAAREVPGVSSAALATDLPMRSDGGSRPYIPEGLDPSFGEHGVYVSTNLISEGLFATLGIPVLEGRPLQRDDGTSGELVAIVNQAFVQTYWPHAGSVIGRTVAKARAEEEEVYRVVGVAGDVRDTPGSAAEPTIHIHVEQEPPHAQGMSLLVRTKGNSAQLAAPLRDLVRRLDPSLPVQPVTTLPRLVRDSVVEPRFYTVLAVGLALFALALALAGVYGTTSYSTGRRGHEIGIRMALGADRGRVIRGILTGTSLAAFVGVAIGLLGGSLGARYLGGFLFGIESLDIPTYSMVALVIGVTVILSALPPAHRAAGLNPAATLRKET
jgi:putative ABC transport system permease protein